MRAPVYIGDEVTGAGLHLAGVRVVTPAPGTERAALERARREADLVLLSTEVAAALPPALVEHAGAADQPLLVVVPDIRGRVPLPDPEAGLRRQLGIAE
jgi:vacuolar-type H+-ATPase subunit F/Vma7